MRSIAEQCGVWARIACHLVPSQRLLEQFARSPRLYFRLWNRALMQAIARLPEPERAQWLDLLAQYAPDELPERLNTEQAGEFWTAYFKAV